MSDLRGKVAIVTGGSRGIGYAIAEELVGAGAHVAITSRTAAGAAEAANRLANAAGTARVLGIESDVRERASCEALIDRVVSELGRLDLLVNNAGVGRFAQVAELSDDDWRDVLGTNLDGVFYCSRAALPRLKESGGGWIINIGSLAGRNAFPGGAAYNASKFGLLGFSEAFMQEVRHDGVRVSLIMPGSVATDFRGAGATGKEWKSWPEDVARAVLDLLAYPDRTLPSRIELRPSRPPRR